MIKNEYNMDPSKVAPVDMSSQAGMNSGGASTMGFIEVLRLGYQPTLHRGLSPIMDFTIGFTEVAVLTSICIMLGFGLEAGGPVVVFWGFVVNFFVTMIISLSLCEICAAYPSAGSVYQWAGQMSPPKYSFLIAYFCGWANLLGNAAGNASWGIGFGSFLSATLVASGYEAIEPQAQVGVSIAILFAWTMLNHLRIDKVGWFNNAAAVVQICSVVIIAVVLLVSCPKHSSAKFVFTEYFNDTSFESQSYVSALGITAALFSFAGWYSGC